MKTNADFSAFIPYSTHVAGDVVRTKGGEYLMSWRLNGIAHAGVDPAQLNHRHDVLNRWLQSLRAPDSSNVAVWTHEFRVLDKGIQRGISSRNEFAEHLANAHLHRMAERAMFRTEAFLTLLLRPSKGRKSAQDSADGINQHIAKIRELATMLEHVLDNYGPTRLGVQSTMGPPVSTLLGLFSRLINGFDRAMPVPRAPVHSMLGVSSLEFAADGSDWSVQTPNSGRKYAAILGIKEFPEQTSPGTLNALHTLPFEYVLTQSFSPLGRHQALRALERTKGRLISVGDKAVSQIRDLDEAMDGLSSGSFLFGEHHLTLAVHASNRKSLARNVAEAFATLTDQGFIASRETLGTVPGFWAQLPGNWKYRPRIQLLSSRNFLGLAPFQRGIRGKSTGNPWGRAVCQLRTMDSERFHFNFHVTPENQDNRGDMVLGNALVIGKSGTGKTALVNFLLGLSQRLDPPPRLFMFDKDHGAALFVKAMNGHHFGLRKGVPSGLNPLQMPDVPGRVEFLTDWIRTLADRETLNPGEERELQQAIEAILDAEPSLRTLSNLRRSLPNRGDECLFARLRKWTAGQSLAWVFDNPNDLLDVEKHSVFAFDYTEVVDDPVLRIPVIQYLLFRLESILDGRRLIYVMDEFWKILEGESGLREFARNKQKTIRKQNGLGIFATQSPEDALRSPVAAAIIEQTATLILLPNPNASRADYVDGLKLNNEEFAMVQSLGEHSRQFVIKQGDHCVVCQLDLSGMHDILTILSSSTASVNVLRQLNLESSSFREWLPKLIQQAQTHHIQPLEAV